MNRLRRWSEFVFLTGDLRAAGLAGAILLLAAILRLGWWEAVYFNEFAERDWYRTWEILTGRTFHYAGSELTQGGRLPGPWMYWLQLIPMVISTHPRSLFYFIGLLGLAAVYLTYRFGARCFGVPAGLAAMGLFAAFPLATLGLRYLWNPTLIFPFTALVLYALAALVRDDKPRPGWLFAAAAAIPIITCCHISGLYLLLLSVGFLVVFRPPLRQRHYAIAAVIFLAMFIPFLAGDALNDFKNLKPILTQQETWSMAGMEHKPSVDRRYQFNSSSIHGLLFNVYPRTWDESYFGAFTYYLLFLEQAPDYFGRIGMGVIRAVQDMARLHLVLFAASVIWALWRIAAIRRRPDWKKRRPLLAALTLCLALPLLVLAAQSGMAFSAGGEKLGTGVHYFYIIYPAQFLIVGAFVHWLANYFSRVKGIQWAIYSILGVWITLQSAFVAQHLTWSTRSGYFMQFIETPVANLGVCSGIADALVTDIGITRASYPTHVQELDRILNYGWGTESGLDFLVNQHPEITGEAGHDSSGAPFVYIIDRNLPHPELAQYAIEREIEIGPVALCVSRDGMPRVWDPDPLPADQLRDEFPRPLVNHNDMMNPFIHYRLDQ